MATIRQYPHYLFLETSSESVQDENGNWTVAQPEREFVSVCRLEPDGRGTEYQVAGGDYIKATALIQCPQGCPAISNGTRVVVANDDAGTDVRMTGIVLNSDAAQLHTRIWV